MTQTPLESVWSKRDLPYIEVGFNGVSIKFSHFSDDQLPLSTVEQANLEFTQLGLGYATGPARTQRKIWNVAAYVTKQEWLLLQQIFNSWDASRATGVNTAVVDVTDTLIGSYTGTAFFTSTPTLTKVDPGNNYIFIANFALTEV